MFEHHVSETHIMLETSSHSSNSSFKLSKLGFNTSNIDMNDITFFQILCTSKVRFHSFGLKYEASKFDFVTSSKKFVSGSLSSNLVKVPLIKLSERASFININKDIFKIFGLRNHVDIKLVFNPEEGQCLKLYQTKLMLSC